VPMSPYGGEAPEEAPKILRSCSRRGGFVGVK
jgi:hypothetical protein